MPIKTFFLLLLVIVVWSSNFVVIKIGVTAIDPLLLLGMRFTLAGLIFIPFMKWPGWPQARRIMLVGLLMGPIHQGLLYVGMTLMPAGLVSVVMQSNIIIVTLIGWLFLKESVGWRTWLGIFVGILGVGVLVGVPDGNTSVTGYALILTSAIFIALTYIAMKKVDKVHPPTYIALMSLPVAPLILLSSYLIEGTDWIDNAATLDWKTISSVVFYQALFLSLSHMLWQKLLVKMPVSQIVPWTLLVPVFAVTSAIIFLDEKLTTTILLGGALTLVGVTIITFRKIQKSIPVEAESID